MADIATLGLAVDSSQVSDATDALTQLAAAAKPAAAGASALAQAAGQATPALDAHGKAAKGAAAAHGGLSTQAMSAQHSIRAMVEGLASGMPVSMIFGQQLNHLAYAATGPGGIKGAFTEALGAITRLVSPTVLIGGAIAGVVAGGYLLYSSIKSNEKAFDDTSRAIGTTIGQLHQLQSAASIKGIGQDDFLAAMDKFGAAVYQAQSGMGALAQVFRANNVQASSLDDYLAKAADLIKNATTDQQRLQLLQQMGLPATMDWVRFLSQGSDQLREVKSRFTDVNSEAYKLAEQARKSDEAWNTFWTNFATKSKYAFVSAISGIGELLLKMNHAFYNYQEPNGPPTPVTITKGNGTTVDPNVLKQNIANEQQRLGILGQTATVEQQVRQVELQIQQARLNDIPVSKQEAQALKDIARERALGIDQIKAQADAYDIQTATIGMSVGEAAAYTAEQNRLNQAVRDHQTLTGDDIQKIHDQAQALGDAAERADTLKSAYDGLVRGPLQTLVQSIQNGSNFFDALKQAGVSALNAISSKLVDMAASNLWQNALGGSGGLASLFGLGGGSGAGPVGVVGAAGNYVVPTFHSGFGPGDSIGNTRSVPASLFANAPRFHSGIGPGERAAIIRTDESVLTPGQMKAVGGGGSATVHMGDTNITVQGSADPQTVAILRAELARRDAELPHRVVQYVRVAQNQRKL